MNTEGTASSETRKILPPRGSSLITSLRYIGRTILFYIILLFNTIFSLIGVGKEKHGEMPISMPNSSARDNIDSSDNFNTPNSDVKDVRRNSIPDSQAPSSLTNTLQEEPNGNKHTVLVLDETKALAEAVANDALSDVLASSASSTDLPEPAGDETKNTLVIKNLPFKFKQSDLDVLLNTYTAKPKNVRLMRDNAGRFTGIAFIRCPSKEEAGRLIQSMNNLDIGGRNIQVEFKKKKTKKKLGESSDSDFSNCSSLRSSAEYLNYNPEEVNEPPREFLGARRMSLRTSAEYAREQVSSIGREHLQTNLPNFPEPLKSNLAPAPQNLQRRRPSFTPQTSMEAAFNQSYFQQQPFSIPQQAQRTPPRKPAEGLRKSTEEIPALYTFLPNTSGHNGMVGFPPERRRSIATPEELSGFRNNQPARSGYVRPFTLTTAANQGPTIQPIRQPIGPDGRTNGFSEEYRKSRTVC